MVMKDEPHSGSNIKIRYTGIKSGEKFYEEIHW